VPWRATAQGKFGARVEAFDEQVGRSSSGGMNWSSPNQCRPCHSIFWNDPDGQLSRELLQLLSRCLEVRHRIKILPTQVSAASRSPDFDHQPHGVRMAAAGFYRSSKTLPEVPDSLIVGWSFQVDDTPPLFIVLTEQGTLDDTLSENRREYSRQRLSSPFLDDILVILEVPARLTGRSEVPIKQFCSGLPSEKGS